jgi:hypothetical protein
LPAPCVNSQDWRDRKLQEWLFLLLRFAISREPADWSAVFAMADELDSLGVRWRPSAPRFFRRTTYDVCQAIVACCNRHTSSVLRTHMARIDNPRLRQAFGAVLDLNRVLEPDLKRNAVG